MNQKFGKYKDSQLFASLKENQETAEAAFAEIYSRYSQRVFAYCLRVIGDEEEAKDVFQETFIKFFSISKELKAIDNIAGYLITVARNLCLNVKRTHKAEPILNIDNFSLTSNDESMDQREMLQLVASALELLDHDLREAFVLRQYQCFSYNEIAEIVGDSVTAVKNRVWRAKERIKDILSPYLIEMSK